VGSNAAISSTHSSKGTAASKHAAHNDSNSVVDSSNGGGGDGGVGGSMSGSGVLPFCRYLSADSVSIAANDEVEAGQTFAAALPHLTVGSSLGLSFMPQFRGCFAAASI
jgi:hypothetical protein